MTKSPEDQSLVSIIVSAAIDRLAQEDTEGTRPRDGLSQARNVVDDQDGCREDPVHQAAQCRGSPRYRSGSPHPHASLRDLARVRGCRDEVFGGVVTEFEREWIDFFEGMGMLTPPADLEKRAKLQKILLAHDWEEECEA